MIISVGYRVNSIKATQFRQWATQRLKDYLVKGYAINKKRLEQKNHSFVDGNKRIAAACFLYFLDKNKTLFDSNSKTIISNGTLASLTLFIATSKTKEAEIVKRLVISILNRNDENK